MFRLDGGRPNDQRGFLHKSFIGRAVGRVVGTVIGKTPIGFAARTIGTILKPPRRPTLPVGVPPALPSETAKQIGKQLKFGNGNGNGFSTTLPFRSAVPEVGSGTGCQPPLVACKGNCVSPNSDFGRRCLESIGVGVGEETFPGGGGAVGEAVMGRFGAGLQPGVATINRAVCLTGMILGEDGLCYNKGQITNSQRMWPRGRRPLLTGGDMRAIAIAARAGRRLEATTKRLQGLGMIKKPASRRALPRHQHAKQIAAVSV